MTTHLEALRALVEEADSETSLIRRVSMVNALEDAGVAISRFLTSKEAPEVLARVIDPEAWELKFAFEQGREKDAMCGCAKCADRREMSTATALAIIETLAEKGMG